MSGTATRRSVLLGTALAAAQRSDAQALPANLATTTALANSGTVGIISGGVDGTYIRIAADLAAVLDDGNVMRVLPIIGKGSLQNLADIVYLRGVDLGIVQSDALAFVLRENMFPGSIQAINYIAKLYDEEVHVLARQDIGRLEDLAGRPVNMDVRGSGTAITAGLIFSKLNIAVKPTYDVQDVALQRLSAGEVAAMVFVTGKPARLFSGIGADTKLHFLSVPPTADLLDTYLPTELGHDVYPALVPDGSPVETLAVGAVLAVFGWQPGTERHRKVSRFIAALVEKLPQLQAPPRHPKWREVNLAAQAIGWTRFSAAKVLATPTRPRMP